MDLQKLKTFQTVATLMHFNQAAEVLHYAQSSVSAQIRALETEVGVPLFQRTGKKVSLTRAGVKMLKYANKLLAIGEEALADLNGQTEPAGMLTIRAPQTVATHYLPQVLARFHPRFPKVRLDVNSCAFHALKDELRIGTVDLAFLLADTIRAPGLKVEMLATLPLLVVAAPDHQLAGRPKVGYADLENVTVFLPKGDCGYRMPFEQALTARRMDALMIMEFNTIEAIKECVKSGQGVTVIPELAVRNELRSRELIALQWNEPLETVLLMLWHQERWLSPALEGFQECVRQVVGDTP